jgi:hypothetical protein
VTLGHIRSHGCRDLLVYCDTGRSHPALQSTFHFVCRFAQTPPSQLDYRAALRRELGGKDVYVY